MIKFLRQESSLAALTMAIMVELVGSLWGYLRRKAPFGLEPGNLMQVGAT